MKHEAKENLRHDQGLVDGNTINQFCFWEEWVVGWKQVINSFVGRAGIDIGSIFFIWLLKKHPSMAKLSNYLGFSPPNKVQSIKIIGREQRIQWDDVRKHRPQRATELKKSLKKVLNSQVILKKRPKLQIFCVVTG